MIQGCYGPGNATHSRRMATAVVLTILIVVFTKQTHPDESSSRPSSAWCSAQLSRRASTVVSRPDGFVGNCWGVTRQPLIHPSCATAGVHAGQMLPSSERDPSHEAVVAYRDRRAAPLRPLDRVCSDALDGEWEPMCRAGRLRPRQDRDHCHHQHGMQRTVTADTVAAAAVDPPRPWDGAHGCIAPTLSARWPLSP